jgi:hypothetical protein
MRLRARSLEWSIRRRAKDMLPPTESRVCPRSVREWVFLLVTLIALPVSLIIAAALAAAMCALILAIPWSAVVLVAPGNWLPADASFPPVRTLDECLVRIGLMYLGIAMVASLQEPRPNRPIRATASQRQVLTLLPVSDAAIRRQASPWRAWPGLFAYGLLVFGSLEWYHGPRVALSAVSVPFFALCQAWLTLASAGIAKILWRQGQWSQVMVATAGLMAILASVLAPSDQSTWFWVNDSLLGYLPTGWLLAAWHGGWLQGRAMPWLCIVDQGAGIAARLDPRNHVLHQQPHDGRFA